jgi:hypothetical protein
MPATWVKLSDKPRDRLPRYEVDLPLVGIKTAPAELLLGAYDRTPSSEVLASVGQTSNVVRLVD